MRKGLLLILALLLPAMIFTFLHFFGSNKFEVPIYHQTTISDKPENCDINYELPYSINETIININGESVVFFSSTLDQDEVNSYWFQLHRIRNELKHQLPVIPVSTPDDSKWSDQLVVLDKYIYEREKRCVWLSENYRLVLLDGNKQIRGYYKDGSLKEVDRLIMEAKILFNEY